MKFEIISIDRIRPNPFQPRESFTKEEIEELAESIRGSGLVQPILLREKGETYEIIAGERRWRAAQFSGLEEIPAIIREADDVESRELSLIENWHRLALRSSESESFISKLYEDGTKAGAYKSVNDMAKKIGIPEVTLREIITAQREKKELGIRTGANLSYTDLRETRVLKDFPGLRKQVLELREHGKLARDELRNFSKTARGVSQPVKNGLLALRIKPEEARIIERELTSELEKIEAMKMIENERKPDRIVSLVRFIKEVEEKKREIEIIKQIDTGDIWLCPICKKKYHLIHIKPSKTHRFEEVVE